MKSELNSEFEIVTEVLAPVVSVAALSAKAGPILYGTDMPKLCLKIRVKIRTLLRSRSITRLEVGGVERDGLAGL